MATHAYWRVNVTAITGGGGAGGTTLGLVEFRTSKGGAQAATGGTAIESGHISTFVPANAFDTNPVSYWASPVLGGGQYIGYHFAAPVDILQYAMTVFTGAARTDDPKDFTLDFSDDGIAWTTADTRTGFTWTSGETKAFNTDGVTTERVTQEVVETLSDGTPNSRVTQEVVETLSDGTPNSRVTQFAIELLTTNTPTDILVTQDVVEVLSSVTELPTNLRVTQDVVEVLSLGMGEARLTQFVRLALEQPTSEEEVTWMGRLAVVELAAENLITALPRLVLADSIPCLTHWAHCWRIERLDGVIFTFTSHDEPMNFRQETYQPCDSLSATASELGAKLGDIGNSELNGIISDDSITDEDIAGGKFDGAMIEVWMVPWNNEGGEVPRRLIAGRTGRLNSGDEGFKMEVLTPSAQLQQHSITESFTPTCRFDLGDSRCTVNLAALLVTGTVTDLAVLNASTRSSKRTFYDTTRGEATGYFNQGKLTWTSGDNLGASSEVKSYDLGTGQFILWQPMIFPIQIGDTYELTPGCDKTKPTCIGKFNNMINFGGFPDIPGIDALSRTPDR